LLFRFEGVVLSVCHVKSNRIGGGEHHPESQFPGEPMFCVALTWKEPLVDLNGRRPVPPIYLARCWTTAPQTWAALRFPRRWNGRANECQAIRLVLGLRLTRALSAPLNPLLIPPASLAYTHQPRSPAGTTQSTAPLFHVTAKSEKSMASSNSYRAKLGSSPCCSHLTLPSDNPSIFARITLFLRIEDNECLG
jgi:hypothetical protein